MLNVRNAIVIYKGKSILNRLVCLDCQQGFAEGDRVFVSEASDDDGTIAIAYHEQCAPEDQLAKLYERGKHG